MPRQIISHRNRASGGRAGVAPDRREYGDAIVVGTLVGMAIGRVTRS
jgi:hypothetical protein